MAPSEPGSAPPSPPSPARAPRGECLHGYFTAAEGEQRDKAHDPAFEDSVVTAEPLAGGYVLPTLPHRRFEHVLPFDTARMREELSGTEHPTIWTA